MAALVWLASYPKSGNTWARALLAAYAGEGDIDLNRLAYGASVTDIRLHGELLGASPDTLRPRELLALRPDAARCLARLAAEQDGPAVHKVHMANLATPTGERAFPADAGRALYVVRNPLDVAASWAPFFGIPTDRAIRALADPGYVLNPRADRFMPVVPEPLLSWSGHVTSWLDAPGAAVHVLRYEDLAADPAAAFTEALRFLGEAPDPARVAMAVEAARFERLREREAQGGFREHPPIATAPFFRRGRAGTWREELTPAQARRVVADHGPTMRRLGYGDIVEEVERGASNRSRI